MAANAPATAQKNAESFDVLKGHKTMNVTSYYEDGRGVTTPVWFVEQYGKIYFFTFPITYKVKRIRVTSDVEIGPSDGRGKPVGPVVKAQARIIDDNRDQVKRLRKAFNKRYRPLVWMVRLGELIKITKRVYIEVSR
jgi:PPOX class probable F420-dependent enzyme